MSTCNIKIYRTQLTPARNALVDELERYLADLTPIYSNPSFQYQQLGLDLTIKVNVTQSKITESSLGNYVRIEQDDRVWYYFILGAQWKGKKTVQLALSIDSINTFRNDLHWTDKTTIVRQHGDRFVKQSNNSILRRIDRDAEGIAAEKIRDSVSTVLEENNLKWYLMYRTRRNLTPDDYSNPIHCYLFADKPVNISGHGAAGSFTITTETLQSNRFYYFNRWDNPNGVVTIEDINYTVGNTYSVRVSTATTTAAYEDRILQGVVITVRDGKISYGFQWNKPVINYIGNVTTNNFMSNTAPGYLVNGRIEPTGTISSDLPMDDFGLTEVIVVNGIKWLITDALYTVAEQSVVHSDGILFTIAGDATNTVNDLSTIDRTDSRIMKIIELPYMPADAQYVLANDSYIFGDNWVFEDGYMRLKNLEVPLENNIGEMPLYEFNTSGLIPSLSVNAVPQDDRDDERESKLFHSEFYTYKAVYDSFAKEIKLEDIIPLADGVYDSNTAIPIQYKHTNTINSKSAFKFDIRALNTSGFADYLQNEDYGEYLLVARNNEVPIYSNDYVNYIRTGYNYDLKAQEIAKKQAWANIGTELASTGLSTMFAGVGRGRKINQAARDLFATRYESTPEATYEADPDYFGSVKGVYAQERREVKASMGTSFYGMQAVSTGTGLIKSFINLLASQAQAKNEMKAKLNTLSWQSTSVAGSDDLDLLDWYNNNKLQLITYTTEPVQRAALADLFHFCGYSHTRQEYPDITSRCWFNFIQCEPEFHEAPYTPFNNYLEDIKARYATGVTVYHCNDGVWDWDQEYENWETLIYPSVAPLNTSSVVGLKWANDKVSFTYLGRNDATIEIELLNVDKDYMDAIEEPITYNNKYKFDLIATEEPVYVSYRIKDGSRASEWQTVALAGG